MSKSLALGLAVADLRPTQMSVGFREVQVKRRQWRDADRAARLKLLRRHVVPAVIGPKGRYYIVDRHHFTKALVDEKVKNVGVYVVADLAALAKSEFWTFLDNNDWCHAYNGAGKRCALAAIPKSLSELEDDPFRSLVGEMIRAGGCAKGDQPFFEFLWADYLRRRIELKLVQDDFETAMAQALSLARSVDAKALPGWAGADPSSD
jgi:hypothetical protein